MSWEKISLSRVVRTQNSRCITMPKSNKTTNVHQKCKSNIHVIMTAPNTVSMKSMIAIPENR